eukprot:c5527_g1_i2.p1 GENE.c5527_g1_i2~~c5527_g1_i2.p1  ORF type:complete len:178 (+),score=56.78 c5527_g1_i2:52-585(+)
MLNPKRFLSCAHLCVVGVLFCLLTAKLVNDIRGVSLSHPPALTKQQITQLNAEIAIQTHKLIHLQLIDANEILKFLNNPSIPANLLDKLVATAIALKEHSSSQTSPESFENQSPSSISNDNKITFENTTRELIDRAILEAKQQLQFDHVEKQNQISQSLLDQRAVIQSANVEVQNTV